jgi:hypothetical protein
LGESSGSTALSVGKYKVWLNKSALSLESNTYSLSSYNGGIADL